MPEPPRRKRSAAVLTSGGLDSAVLTVDLAREYSPVFPIYVRSGLFWEETELAAMRAFLTAIQVPGLAPLTVLDEPIRDVYGAHWSTIGDGVPDARSADEAVYLPGRNVLLTAKAAVWCRLRKVDFLALGSLGSNPFPDSTPEFFADLESVLVRALNGAPGLIRPFSHLSKRDVVVRGANLPLHLTFSCILPTQGKHCGMCNKCAERQKGFRDAGLPDRTEYARDLEPQDGRSGAPLASPPSPGAFPTCSA
jgi:7-cyano-7-deazaguanine synthase